MAKNTGGHAFPQHDLSNYGVGPSYPMGGMTLRDYFATKAMGSFVGDKEDMERLADGEWPEFGKMAEFCYRFADAMLAEREKE